MKNFKSIAAVMVLAFAGYWTPAHAVPVLFSISGAGTGTSISGSFQLDSSVINGDNSTDPVSIFNIFDSVQGITWDQTDTVSLFNYFDTPTNPEINFTVTDSTTGLVLKTQTSIGTPGSPQSGIYTAGPRSGIATFSRVPEPAAAALFGFGLAALALARRRRAGFVPG